MEATQRWRRHSDHDVAAAGQPAGGERVARHTHVHVRALGEACLGAALARDALQVQDALLALPACRRPPVLPAPGPYRRAADLSA